MLRPFECARSCRPDWLCRRAGFHFAADQHQPRFIGFVDEVVMPRLAIDADDLLARAADFLAAIDFELVVRRDQTARRDQLERFFHRHVEQGNLADGHEQKKSRGRVRRRRHEDIDQLGILLFFQMRPSAAHGKTHGEHPGARIFDHDYLTLRVRLTEESLHQLLRSGIDAAKNRNLNKYPFPGGEKTPRRNAAGQYRREIESTAT